MLKRWKDVSKLFIGENALFIPLMITITVVIIFAVIVLYTAKVEPKVTTEVYFTNIEKIDHHIACDEPFYMNFTIVNKGSIPSMYRYVIFAQFYNDSNSLVKTLVLGGGNADIKSKDKERFSERTVIPKNYNGYTAKVSVEIYKLGSDRTFEIHYWARIKGENG